MDIGEIRAKVRAGAFVISDHASTEAACPCGVWTAAGQCGGDYHIRALSTQI